MRNLIAGSQNVLNIAHIGNAGSPCCPDAGHRAETCRQQLSQQNHRPKGERDYVLTTAYRLLPETSARMMKALRIHPKLAQSGGVM